MSEHTDDNVDDAENPNIRELREAAERGRQASAEAERLARENAFLKAGVDLSTKAGQYLLDGYKGDLTPEAIKAEAADMGALIQTAPPAPSGPEIPDDERSQSRERSQLAAGAEAPSSAQPDVNPWDAGYAAFHDRRRNGEVTENAAAEVFSRVFDAAGKGDPRVLFDPQTHADQARGGF